MTDLNWLAQEAKQIHAIFNGMFYGLASLLLVLGVVIEYFKLPLGGVPWIPQLIGRTLVAAILLNSYPEVTNSLSDVTDALVSQIGNYNDFHLVLDKMGDKLSEFTFSWTSVKETLMLGFSFITFFLLYISVYIANAGVIFVWVLLFIFSPILIALFILPSTAVATKALYRSLFEVCAWKIVWAVLAALLWSSALGEMNKPEHNINFLTVIAYNLILAASLLFTPIVVTALTSKGMASMASSMMGMAAGAALFNPGKLATATVKKGASTGSEAVGSGYSQLKENYFQDTNKKKLSDQEQLDRDHKKAQAFHRITKRYQAQSQTNQTDKTSPKS
ncbi:MAG: hypothetical protein AB7F66_11065 [Bacteriovoracia bacterium]